MRKRRANPPYETRAWVLHAMFAELVKFQATFKKDPPVPMGASDPYVPPAAGASSASVNLPAPPAED